MDIIVERGGGGGIFWVDGMSGHFFMCGWG